MSIALFYISCSCITYMIAVILSNILMRDLAINRELTKFISGESREEYLRVFLIPIINILFVLVMAYMVYSYHRYTLGYTDYNIFEEGEEDA